MLAAAWSQGPLGFSITLVAWIVALRAAQAEVARDCAPDLFWSRFVRPDAAALSGASRVFNLTAERWYGRMGNNEIEVHNALSYAICCDAVLHIMPNKNFPLLRRFLDFRDGSTPKHDETFNASKSCASGLTGSVTFFGRRLFAEEQRPKNWYAPPKCGYDAYGALSYFLFNNTLPRWCGAPPGFCAPDLDPDQLVVHIRSGDIFGPKPPLTTYMQPPVQFYEAIFSSRNWSKIIMVTEPATELLNPVWNHFLSHNWPGVPMIFQMSSSLNEDMHTLWCAANLVFAKSTLANLFVETSPSLNVVYQASFQGSPTSCGAITRVGIQCHTYSLETYNKVPWTSAAEREREMLAYNGSIRVSDA